MSSRGGRDRYRRHEDRNQGGQSNPPSRHLWVGNLPHSIAEDGLASLFSRFGDLESVAFQPGRSYAFVNFRSTEDAIAAMKALGDSLVAGNAIKVEFTKDKSSSSSRDAEHINRRDEQRSSLRSSSPFSPRDSRLRHPSPDPFLPDKSRLDDKGGGEPSEVLWVGFPAQLKMDEAALRRSFSPFGEIEKITAFPGRTYAYVRFRNIVSASRAKEALHGKLFGNPRVHICFARNDSGGPTSSKSYTRTTEAYPEHGRTWQDRNYGSSRFASLDSEDRDIYDLNRRVLSKDVYGFHGRSPIGERGYSSSSSQRGPVLEPWDLPEEPDILPSVKKRPRTEAFYHDNDDLLEYSFSNLKREKQAVVQMPDRSMDFNAFHRERRAPYEVDSGFQPSVSIERRRATLEPTRLSLKDWKWEGTIAKGGTPICRARCFPVGKAMDMLLPEFLDCTARTSLDMLSKHYYQAIASWVVFFVPESDSEIGFYNEFMHYLEEKQRAAVVKLDERTTMFLVPPSEFSEKVLKVPGRLSIAGVALRLENPTSRPPPDHQYPDANDRYISSYNGDGSPYLRRPSGSSFPSSSQPEQIVQLASLLGQQGQYGNNVPGISFSSGEDYRNMRNQSDTRPYSSRHDNYYVQNTRTMDPELPPISDHHRDFRQFQQQPNVSSGVVPNNAVSQDGGETDPQKRLQATLQLAAALLQQIQGKGT